LSYVVLSVFVKAASNATVPVDALVAETTATVMTHVARDVRAEMTAGVAAASSTANETKS
jgi:hypothetical protein